MSIRSLDGVMKLLLAGLIGAGISGVGHYLAFSREVVTRAEMTEFVRDQSPYTRDQVYIRERLDDIARDARRIHDVEQRLARLEARIDP